MEPYKRIYALRALAKGESQNKVQELIKVLHDDPDPVVRHEAAFWMGEVGTQEAVSALGKTIETDKNTLVRHEAVEALGWIPTEQSKEILRKALNDPDETVRLTAKISLDIHDNPEKA